MKGYQAALLTLGFCLSINISSSAQNLVPNPGMENYSICPTTVAQIDRLDDWRIPTGSPAVGSGVESTPDYFNCSFYTPGFPGGLSGTPHSGAGALGTTIIGLYRESFECSLTSPMTAGTQHTVELWVKYQADATLINNFSGGYPTFGVFFYNSSTSTPSWSPGVGFESYCLETPQVTFSLASITSAYQLFSATYTPPANYDRMVVGYFGGAGTQQRYLNYDDFSVLPSCVNSTAASSASNSVICPGASFSLLKSGGSLGTGANWKWYSGSCGGTLVGTGASINVSPSSTTTYYIRAEGACNTTSCVSTTIVIPAGAGTWIWDGSENSNWFEPCNWNQNAFPNCNSDVIIPNTANKPSISGSQAVCNTIEIQSSSGARLDLNSSSGGVLKIKSQTGSCP
jgi:hypothetical protein